MPYEHEVVPSIKTTGSLGNKNLPKAGLLKNPPCARHHFEASQSPTEQTSSSHCVNEEISAQRRCCFVKVTQQGKSRSRFDKLSSYPAASLGRDCSVSDTSTWKVPKHRKVYFVLRNTSGGHSYLQTSVNRSNFTTCKAG